MTISARRPNAQYKGSRGYCPCCEAVAVAYHTRSEARTSHLRGGAKGSMLRGPTREKRLGQFSLTKPERLLRILIESRLRTDVSAVGWLRFLEPPSR